MSKNLSIVLKIFISFFLFTLAVHSVILAGTGKHPALTEGKGAAETGCIKSFDSSQKASCLAEKEKTASSVCLGTAQEGACLLFSSAPKPFHVAILKITCSSANWKPFACTRKTAQAIGCTYEFIRLNVLSSKVHPPTGVLS